MDKQWSQHGQKYQWFRMKNRGWGLMCETAKGLQHVTVSKGECHWQCCDLGDRREAKPLTGSVCDPLVSPSSTLTCLSEGIPHLMGVDGARVVTVHPLIDGLWHRGRREWERALECVPCSSAMVWAREAGWACTAGSQQLCRCGNTDLIRGYKPEPKTQWASLGFNLGWPTHHAAPALPSSLLV